MSIIDSRSPAGKVARLMTMLADFLNEQGIKPEDVLAQSRAMEHRHVNDRALAGQRAGARAAKKTYAELNLDKPKSLGRPVSKLALDRALAGTEMPRLIRKKITRAVNGVLVVKKKEPADWRKLFGDVKSKKRPKKK
jgi:hypothetical protein